MKGRTWIKIAVSVGLLGWFLAGVDLPPEQQAEYREIVLRLSKLAAMFSENLLDATHAWTKQITDESELAGLPPSALDLARQTAQQRDMDGWLLTLEFPSYYPVMTYADNRDLRYEMYRAYSTPASDQGPNAGEYDNSVLMDEILTPDSSRFWPADTYEPGTSPRSYDKQFVRDYLETLDWDKRPPPPPIPAEVIEATAAKYREAYERLTGEPA